MIEEKQIEEGLVASPLEQSAESKMPMNPGTKKIYFVETRRGKREKEFLTLTASVNVKHTMLCLSAGAVRTLGIGVKFIKIYADVPNKIVGFRLKSGLKQDEMKNGWKKAFISKAGDARISIAPALRDMKGLQEKYKKMTIKRYKDFQSMMDNETYYYVELK